MQKGGSYQGLGSYVGIKNKRLRLLADEGQLMPRVYVDAIANLNKNKDFKAMVMGNPKETTDALGVVCEPSAELGGWDGGIDQTPGTKTWPTRFSQGVCLQLPGSDCPNMDVPADQSPPYPFLITREAIEADIRFYGKDSLQYTMMDEGRMPRGQGTRRVISRNLCVQFHAFDKPIWGSQEKLVKIGALDAAYRGVGGDRCIFGDFTFGQDSVRRQADGDGGAHAGADHWQRGEIARGPDCRVRGARMQEPQDTCPRTSGSTQPGAASLMAAFARTWSPNVTPIEFGGKPTDRIVSTEIDVSCRDYYSKRVTELWWSVRLVIEAGQFRGMTEEAQQEGSMREWKIVAGNKIEIETKEDMKVKSGRSPDIFDVVACGVEMARVRGFRIARIGNPQVLSSQSMVYKRLREQMQRMQTRSRLSFSA